MREMEKNDLINTTATTEHGFIENKCKDLIKNYKMMFTSVQEKGKCSIKDPIPKTNNHCSSRDRLKPISEQKKRKACNIFCDSLMMAPGDQERGKRKQSFTFCSMAGHRVTNCNIKLSYGREIEVNQAITLLLNSAPFCCASESLAGSVIQDMNWRMVKHLKLHMLFSKTSVKNACQPSSNNMFAKVTCIGSKGESIKGLCKCYIELDEIITFLHKAKSNHSLRKIFYGIDIESIGEKFQKDS